MGPGFGIGTIRSHTLKQSAYLLVISIFYLLSTHILSNIQHQIVIAASSNLALMAESNLSSQTNIQTSCRNATRSTNERIHETDKYFNSKPHLEPPNYHENATRHAYHCPIETDNDLTSNYYRNLTIGLQSNDEKDGKLSSLDRVLVINPWLKCEQIIKSLVDIDHFTQEYVDRNEGILVKAIDLLSFRQSR